MSKEENNVENIPRKWYRLNKGFGIILFIGFS